MPEICECCDGIYTEADRYVCANCEKYLAMIENLKARHQQHHDQQHLLGAKKALLAAGAPRELIVEEVPRDSLDAYLRLKRWRKRA